MEQEQIIQIQMFEQETQQLNQQLQLIEQNISEMQDLNLSLEEIEKEESKEILANLGKGIYIPVDIKDRKLIIGVGNKNFIKKTIPETKNIIQEQLKKLVGGRAQISERLEALQSEIGNLMKSIEGKNKDKGKKK